MSKSLILCTGLALAACSAPSPSSPPIDVQVQLGIHTLATAKSIANVDHFTLQLLNATNSIRATFRTANTTATFHSVPNGTYHLAAEAFDSTDDSSSITASGPQTSTNTVTVGTTVTYSDGGTALQVPLHLNDATGETSPMSLLKTPGHVWTGEPVGGP